MEVTGMTTKSRGQAFALIQKVEELEDTEYPYQAESTNDEQIACTGEEQADVERKGG